LRKVVSVVAGGDTRARSVLIGLKQISAADIVAVHDGVRPFVTTEEIERVVTVAKEKGAAILVAPVTDTIKEIVENHVARTPRRASLRRALTPQAFRFPLLKLAYDRLERLEAVGIEITDDSLLVELLDGEVTLVEGSARNIKITEPEDIVLAEMILKSVASGE